MIAAMETSRELFETHDVNRLAGNRRSSVNAAR
jgi:hypothetical protein